MKTFIRLLVLISISGISGFSQDIADKKCPILEVTGPPVFVRSGETGVFFASLTGGEFKFANYQWSVDEGKILNGQGTSTIFVEAPANEALPTASVTVTTDNGCILTGSDSFRMGGVIRPVIFDEFGNIPYCDFRNRIDLFLIELMNNPDATGYLISYGTDKQIKTREKSIREHIELRNADSSRIIFIRGGKEKDIRTRAWIVPPGADPSEID
jgi:hypothetical protein